MELDHLGDARIVSVDRGKGVLTLTLDCANADHLAVPIQGLRFSDCSIFMGLLFPLRGFAPI